MSDVLWQVALLEDDGDTLAFFERCVTEHDQLALAASFATLREAQAWFADHCADVLLTDLALPDGHGITLIRDVAARCPACDILVVSVFGDEETVIACVEAGAVGYIHKDSQPQDVAQVIVDAKRGASPISPMIARKILQRLRDQSSTPPEQPTSLSPRESEVLELIARGYTYAEIAHLQGVTLHTVQSHIKHLYGKLAVHSRSAAVFEATRMGLLNSMKPPT